MNPSPENLHITEHDSGSWRVLLRYRLMLLLLAPVIISFTLIQSIRGGGIRFLTQRLGLLRRVKTPVDIWIHAASVGEIIAAIPLIKCINAHFPNKYLLVTTTTATGAKIVEQQMLPNTIHRFLPIDFGFAVRHFLKTTKPQCAIVLETEIWPNLFRICHSFNISLFIVNGRLSQRTLHVKPWIKKLYAIALKYPTLILTRSDNDSKAFIALGADASKVKTIGNIKFSAEFTTPTHKAISIPRPYILAASTHDNEELQLAQIWKEISPQLPDYLLVIVPRHPQRLNQILKHLDFLELQIAIRSLQQPVTNSTHIYIADTVGELVQFMQNAQLIFMGGSLVRTGGHNILEPARLAKPIVFGPYMHNFDDEAQLMLSHDAAIQVQDRNQLKTTLLQLIPDEPRRSNLGRNAMRVTESQQNVANKYEAELHQYLSSS